MNETFGLLSSESTPIPLVGVRVVGDILGRSAKVKINQRFINQEKAAVEAVYKFPLPEGSTVCGFGALVDGTRIRSQVEERDRAFEMYDDALLGGDGAYLLDEERPNIFTLSVGNLNPGMEVTVEIEYVILLDTEGRQVRFFLPTTISPRYIPEGMDESDGIPENEKIHPHYSTTVPYGLSLSLNIHSGSLLKSIDSPSHPIRVEHIKGDRIGVALSAESVKMDRDFVLSMEYKASFVSRAYKYQSGNENFIQLDLLPETDASKATDSKSQVQKAHKEVIFVLDCSGSMMGDSIREAKKALEICLRGLDPKTSFSIYRFGSDFECLFNEPEEYSETSLKKGLNYLRDADADLGGTEIMSPLKDIYTSRHCEDHLERSIVLITDGEVGNEEEIFELVRENRKSTRLFTIGIGAACNEYFIKGLARAGRGASEFIYPGERIEPKVLRLFSKIAQERVTDVSIHWGNGHIEQAPTDPAIFLGNVITIFGRCKGSDLMTEKIVVKGNINGVERQWEVNLIESMDENVPIPLLWARERIRDLEETKGELEERGSRQRVRRRAQRKEAIVNLSKTYGILSQSTSFVAIEEREETEKTTGELVLRKIPVPLAIGWHGIGSVFGIRESPVKYSAATAPAMLMEDIVSYERTCEFVVRDHDKTDMVLEILSLQKAEGGMELNERVARLLCINYEQLKGIVSDIEVEIEVDKHLLLSTIILLQVLETYFSKESNLWRDIVAKSRDWLLLLLSQAKPKIGGRDITSWVEKYVQENINI